MRPRSTLSLPTLNSLTAELQISVFFAAVGGRRVLSFGDIGSLACVCRFFAGLIEEAARNLVAARTDTERSRCPRRVGERWLSVLYDIESRSPGAHVRLDVASESELIDDGGYVDHPPLALPPFVRIGELVSASHGPADLRDIPSHIRTACCVAFAMRAGVHRAYFKIKQSIGGVNPDSAGGNMGLCIGIVAVRSLDELNSRPDAICWNSWGTFNEDRGHPDGRCWPWRPLGQMADGRDDDMRWEGQQPYTVGDTVGLELNLETGTLTAFKQSTTTGIDERPLFPEMTALGHLNAPYMSAEGEDLNHLGPDRLLSLTRAGAEWCWFVQKSPDEVAAPADETVEITWG